MNLVFSERDCLEWNVAESIGLEALARRIRNGPPLQVKLGIDPTSPDIHLGRSIPLWRLRAFQELGHEIHFIVGNFTAQIGDTSDKSAERPMLAESQVADNLLTYLDQVWLILSLERKEQVHIHYNADWLNELSLRRIGELADAFSVNSFVKRELIAKRLSEGGRVSLREMLYPLMQGYDSLAVSAEIELGGTDQRFNLLAGRTLQERQGLAPQGIIMNPLVAGTDGRKMSSSWGNVISLHDAPADKFGKVMSIPDGLLSEYLGFLPYSAQPFASEELVERLRSGENPRDLKLAVASALVELYHGPDAAGQARSDFLSQFSDRQPTSSILLSADDLQLQLLDLIANKTEWNGSRSELREVFRAGGVQVDGAKVLDPQTALSPSRLPATLKVGKRILVRLTPAA